MMCKLSVTTTILAAIALNLAHSENSTKPVYFSLIYSGGEHGHNSSGVIATSDQYCAGRNTRPAALTRLQPHLRDSQKFQGET